MKSSPGPDWNPRTPAFRAPAGAVDCHAHLFGPRSRYPYAVGRSYTPVESGIDRYVAVLDAVGIDRAVIVQGSPQGTDNRVVIDAISAYPDRLRGIAVVDPSISNRDLEALARGGIRGMRMSDAIVPGTPLSLMESFADRVVPFGWHVQLLLGRCEDVIAMAPRIEKLRIPVVIDHMASVTSADGLYAAGFRRLIELVRDCDHVWVKIAAIYRRSQQGFPYVDMRPMACALAETRSDRLIWGTNWPHPVYDAGPPNDGDLVDLFADWFADPGVQRRILVENPEQLFGFDARQS